jgi:hypothetical protein
MVANETVEKPTHVTRELFGADIDGGTKEHPLKGLRLRSDAREGKGKGWDPFFPPRLRQFSALAMSPSLSVALRLCGEMGTPHPIKPALGSLRSSEN